MPERRRVRLFVDVDNCAADLVELGTWARELAASVGDDLDGGEIVSEYGIIERPTDCAAFREERR